jgi:hypothetical protein
MIYAARSYSLISPPRTNGDAVQELAPVAQVETLIAPPSQPGVIAVPAVRQSRLHAAHVGSPFVGRAGATPLAALETEYAENAFPALPVREGEYVFVWFARFTGQQQLDAYLAANPGSSIGGKVSVLQLSPTQRSLLR